MDRWLLISNCSTVGLTQSFQLLNPNFEVVGVDIWQYRQNPNHYHDQFKEFSRLIVHPEILPSVSNGEADNINLSVIPGIYFDSYHPDMCMARSGGNNVSGRMSDYHSIITIAAFNEMLSPQQTRSLFCRDTYKKAGYFDTWTEQRDALLQYFGQFGLDLRATFLNWSRSSTPFMYSMNHPRINVTHDIAKLFMESNGIETFKSGVLPPDNVVIGPCFPVYSEIAEELGVDGCYEFKRLHEYRYETLDEFILGSFAEYGHCADPIIVPDQWSHRYQRVLSVIRGEA